MRYGVRISVISSVLLLGLACLTEAGTLEVYFRAQNVRHTLFTLYEGQFEYIHLNKIADMFGFSVNIDSVNGRVVLRHGEKTASFFPGQETVTANGRTHYLDAPPRRIQGIIMAPMQFLLTIVPLIHDGEMTWDPGMRRFIVETETRKITDLLFTPYGEYTRILVEMNQPISYKVSEKLPSLLIFELPQMEFSLPQNPLPIDSQCVKHVKVAQSFGSTQVVIRLAGDVSRYTHQTVSNPPRLVIDVYTSAQPPVSATPAVEAPPAEQIAEEDLTEPGVEPPPAGQIVEEDFSEAPIIEEDLLPEEAENFPAPTSRRQFALRTIVIDPGHGGSDPGVLLGSGTEETGELYEKQMTLKIAQLLKTRLAQRFGRVPVLTREGDDFVSPEARTTIANSNRADIFLSIHLNKSPSAVVSGLEAYVMDYGSVDLPVGYESVSAQSQLLDYAQAKHITQSERLAETIVSVCAEELGEGKCRVKHAPLFTLKGATMPAVHLELSYASHPLEQARIQQADFQQRLVGIVTRGIAAFKHAEESLAAQE